MYSGQEIVSQEQCKIIYAEFFEGVECYNASKRILRLNLKDWIEYTYDAATNTLTTKYFIIRPVIFSGRLDRYIDVIIPENITGLEITMTADIYSKKRIMPLDYIPFCKDYSPYTCNELLCSFIYALCSNPGNLTIQLTLDAEPEILGTKLYISSKSNNTEPISITFFNGTNEEVALSTPVVTTETVQEEYFEYVQSSDTVERKTRNISVLQLQFNGLSVQDYRITGSCTAGAPIRSCYADCLIDPAGLETICFNSPNELRLTSAVSNIINNGDGTYTLGTSKFSFDRDISLIRQETSGSKTLYYFPVALKLQLLEPYEAIFDIHACSDYFDPGEGGGGSIITIDYTYAYVEIEQDLNNLSDIKYKLVIISTRKIENLLDNHEFYFISKTNGELYRLWFTPSQFTSVGSSSFYTHTTYISCETSEVVYSVHKELNPTDYDYYDTYLARAQLIGLPYYVFGFKWDNNACDYTTDLDVLNDLVPDCAHWEKDDTYTYLVLDTGDNQICTCRGIMNLPQYTNACEQDNLILPFGQYPSLGLVSNQYGMYVEPIVATSEFLYVSGADVYMAIKVVGFENHYYYIQGFNIDSICQTIAIVALDGTQYTISPMAMVLLDSFGIPPEYIKNGTLDQSIFSSDLAYEINGEKAFNGTVYEAQGFDFKIPFTQFNLLVFDTSGITYDWSKFNDCKWVRAVQWADGGLKPYSLKNNDISKSDELMKFGYEYCKATVRLNIYNSNIRFIASSVPLEDYIIPPSFNDKYSAFVDKLRLSIAKEDATSAQVYNKGAMTYGKILKSTFKQIRLDHSFQTANDNETATNWPLL